MNTSTTAAGRLSAAVGQATRSARFCVAGSLPAINPVLEVDDLPPLRLPLKPAMVRALVARCRVAPYGKGTATLVNRKVRNTLELDPKHFSLGQAWCMAVADAAKRAAGQLGLPADQVELRLYKLLVYEKGGFFLPHRDSEKHDGMVASLIVVLPNPFSGGALVVRHGSAQQTLPFEDAAHGRAPCYAAFYADCEHEVQRVTKGVRLCLAYNLVLKPRRDTPSASRKPARPANALVESIRSWTATQPGKPLVFALAHHYTQRGLSLDLLKGADRQLAASVVAAAEHSACLVHLTQISRHLSQFADDGSFERDYYRRYYEDRPRGALVIGETYEDDLHGESWTDVHGKKQPWGEIALEPSAIVSSIPLDDWKPTSEEYEGYTGNAGNTLDRWYHRSAIVVWHRDHHFDVVAGSGPAVSIPLFRALVAKLAKTPKKRFEAVRSDAIRFARAIIARWPRTHAGFGYRATPETLEIPDLLLTLRDRDTIAQFLGKVAEVDQALPLASFVIAACRAFGWTAFAPALRQLLSERPTQPTRYLAPVRQSIPPRDLEWLAAFCLDKTADTGRTALANELCALAMERFCAPFPPRPAYRWRHDERERTDAEATLPLLLKAHIASDRDEDLRRVIDFVESTPDEFSLDHGQVPALKAVVPWARKEYGAVHPLLRTWLASVRKKLQAATARKPVPPDDWARPAEVACTCEHCARLNAFLADRTQEVGRIPAREDRRQHVIGMIAQHQCDVKHGLERAGSPYSLILTKTVGSFERALKRYEADCQLLESLDKLGT